MVSVETLRSVGATCHQMKEGAEPRPLQTTPTKGHDRTARSRRPHNGGVALSAASVVFEPEGSGWWYLSGSRLTHHASIKLC